VLILFLVNLSRKQHLSKRAAGSSLDCSFPSPSVQSYLGTTVVAGSYTRRLEGLSEALEGRSDDEVRLKTEKLIAEKIKKEKKKDKLSFSTLLCGCG
jgi:hypothetical protein